MAPAPPSCHWYWAPKENEKYGSPVGSPERSAPLGAIVLLGMVGYFSGVVQAPITAFVIVSEMTSDHHMLLPLMATALIATAASRAVCREGVYHALAKKYLKAENSPSP